jgi:putative addiction module killer protein
MVGVRRRAIIDRAANHCDNIAQCDGIELRFMNTWTRSAILPSSDGSENLNARAAAKMAVALYRLEQGNFSKVEGVGAGVFEYKIDFGPGYRIYFGKDGERVIILLGGSGKKRQSTAISAAQDVWIAYKRDKTRKKPRQQEG